MPAYTVRRFQTSDAEVVAALIAGTLRETNARDYTAGYIESTIKRLSPAHLIQRATWTHFYVICDCGCVHYIISILYNYYIA